MRKGRRRCQLSGSSNQVTNRPPPPPPPRRQPRNKLKPPAAFRIAARRTQLRRPRPGTIGDLDPDNAVPGPDRDRHRPPGSTRAAGPDRITEDLADQQDGRISARVPRAEYLTDERTGGPRPAPPARQASRSPGPSSPHPPCPGRPAPGNRPGSGRTQRHARSAQPRTSSRARGRLRGPLSVARPWSRPPSVAVHAKPTAPHTAPWPRFPSAIRPWTPRQAAPQRSTMTHHGQRRNSPHSRDIPVPAAAVRALTLPIGSEDYVLA